MAWEHAHEWNPLVSNEKPLVNKGCGQFECINGRKWEIYGLNRKKL
jgi:hypothetical protein